MPKCSESSSVYLARVKGVAGAKAVRSAVVKQSPGERSLLHRCSAMEADLPGCNHAPRQWLRRQSHPSPPEKVIRRPDTHWHRAIDPDHQTPESAASALWRTDARRVLRGNASTATA